MPGTLPPSTNFGFLARYDEGLGLVATRAEQCFPDDPVIALMMVETSRNPSSR